MKQTRQYLKRSRKKHTALVKLAKRRSPLFLSRYVNSHRVRDGSKDKPADDNSTTAQLFRSRAFINK